MNNRGKLFIYYCCKTLCFVGYSLFLVVGIVSPIFTWKIAEKTQEMAPVRIYRYSNMIGYEDYHAGVWGYSMIVFILPGLFGLIYTALGKEQKVSWILWYINLFTICWTIWAIAPSLISCIFYKDCKEVGSVCVCRSSIKNGPVIKFSNSCADVHSLNLIVKVHKVVIYVGLSLWVLWLFFHFCFMCGDGKDEEREDSSSPKRKITHLKPKPEDKQKRTKTPKARKFDQRRSKPKPTVKCISKPTTGKSDNDKAADEYILRGEPNIYVEFPSFPAPRDASGNDESSPIHEKLKF